MLSCCFIDMFLEVLLPISLEAMVNSQGIFFEWFSGKQLRLLTFNVFIYLCFNFMCDCRDQDRAQS